MIYSDVDLSDALAQGILQVQPYDESLLQPASLDCRLDRYFRRWPPPTVGAVIDPYAPEDFSYPVEGDSLVLRPGEFVLGSTLEWWGFSTGIVGRIEGKSSLARLGLIVHTTAGFIDPGFSGYITLELVNVSEHPLKVHAGMPIAQMAVLECRTPASVPYDAVGKYGRQQRGPTASRYHRNAPPVVT